MHTLAAPDRWEAHYAAGRDFRPVLSEEETTFDQHVGRGIGLTALDIGCGTGGFARFLREHGYSVLGVDYAEAAVSRAVEHVFARMKCWKILRDCRLKGDGGRKPLHCSALRAV